MSGGTIGNADMTVGFVTLKQNINLFIYCIEEPMNLQLRSQVTTLHGSK